MKMRARSSLVVCSVILGSLAWAAGPAQAVPSTWSVTSTPNSSSGSDQLNGISCAGPSFCVTAGSGYFRTHSGTVPGPLAEAWNGRAWTVTSVPRPGGDPDEFLGVSCASSSFCMAVGWYYDAAAFKYHTLAEVWNGTAWRVTPTPSPSVQSVLFGVSCTGPASCQAVGYNDGAASGFATLAESWNGHVWTVIASPDGAGTNSILSGISCLAASDCMAVGSYDGTSGSLTLAEAWNGSRWSLLPSPSPGSGNNGLLGVSCTSAASCEAAGYFSIGFGPHRTLAESWNGSSWSVVPTPDRGSGANDLAAVSCTSSVSCVAVGDTGFAQTLIESWNGSGWSITPSPSPNVSELSGVTCTSASRCQAAGYHGNGSLVSDKTLVETGS